LASVTELDELRAAAEPRPGESVGSYLIESMLGEGGMGRVYRATTPAGEVVALKLVKAEMAKDETFRRRFDREAKMAQKVNHPHVVPVVDTGEHHGVPYLAQQFISGGSLEDKIKENGPLSVPDTVELCTAVATGLDALHAEGLIHRDVKPANILLDEGGNAFITDFGLAKDRDASVLTRPGQTLGSMDYMAPEQIRGEEVNAQTDVYALGCVMYECLVGRPPFADRQGMRILWAHLQDEPPDPTSIRGDLPPEFARTIMVAMAKNPQERPASAGEYARLLAEAANS
jgi:serine/threonine protein kinase